MHKIAIYAYLLWFWYISQLDDCKIIIFIYFIRYRWTVIKTNLLLPTEAKLKKKQLRQDSNRKASHSQLRMFLIRTVSNRNKKDLRNWRVKLDYLRINWERFNRRRENMMRIVRNIKIYKKNVDHSARIWSILTMVTTNASIKSKKFTRKILKENFKRLKEKLLKSKKRLKKEGNNKV